ncbi:copper resistance protein NlpE N-terminal domain-containing protein [Tunicatimonas pelagia]|uniref:copper resistance protein NlpE N-terminal domain-containing protein n=1 Tax=Tunicatimonas pelagia TaxID=931531 RepID=UPI002666F8AC|nr:copper resistance protein NlpE N-terminal domain-containing protein [Tunicatimonas pelagia]WKN44109.1 lipocalin family protein [Tunicatimonas pelagia]
MKNLQKLFSSALTLCLAITLFSCGNDDEEAIFAEADLMGEWTVSSTEINIPGMDLPAEQMALFGAILSIPEGTTIQLNNDKTYEQEGAELGFLTTNESGTWKLEGGKTLVLTSQDNEDKQYQIRSLNSESAVWYISEKMESGDVSIPGATEVTVESTISLKK